MVLIKLYTERAAINTGFKYHLQSKLLIMAGQETENISVVRNYVQLFFARLTFPIKYNKMSVEFRLLFLLYVALHLSTWNFTFFIEAG